MATRPNVRELLRSLDLSRYQKTILQGWADAHEVAEHNQRCRERARLIAGVAGLPAPVRHSLAEGLGHVARQRELSSIRGEVSQLKHGIFERSKALAAVSRMMARRR